MKERYSKIGIIIHEHNNGGSFIFSKDLSKSIKGKLILLSDNHKIKKDFKISTLKLFGKRLLLNPKDIRRLDQDLSMWHINYPTPILLPLFFISKKPKIITFHFMISRHSFRLSGGKINEFINKIIFDTFYKIFINFLVLFSDKLTFITLAQFNEYGKWIIFKKKLIKKSIIINNYIDEKLIKKNKLNNKFKILFIGRLTKVKGFLDLIKIGNELPELIIDVVGSGERFENLNKNINLIGNVSHDKILEYYDKSSILILPSYTEVFPMTILEAMARGLVILASDIPGMREIVKEGRNGYLFPPGDVEKMKEIILYLKNNPKEVERISKNNLKDIWKFTAERQVSKYIKVYEEVLK